MSGNENVYEDLLNHFITIEGKYGGKIFSLFLCPSPISNDIDVVFLIPNPIENTNSTELEITGSFLPGEIFFDTIPEKGKQVTVICRNDKSSMTIFFEEIISVTILHKRKTQKHVEE